MRLGEEGFYIENPKQTTANLPVLHGEVNGIKRTFSVIEALGRNWWADRVTGSLYSMSNGRCMSSGALRITKIPMK